MTPSRKLTLYETTLLSDIVEAWKDLCDLILGLAVTTYTTNESKILKLLTYKSLCTK